MINLWDKLPTELTYEIMDYNKLPYLDELKTKRANYLKPTYIYGSRWNTQTNQHDRVIYDILTYDRIENIRFHKFNSSIYGGSFFVWRGKVNYPNRESIITMMRFNRLRIRRGMKTRTMIHHIIKV